MGTTFRFTRYIHKSVSPDHSVQISTSYDHEIKRTPWWLGNRNNHAVDLNFTHKIHLVGTTFFFTRIKLKITYMNVCGQKPSLNTSIYYYFLIFMPPPPFFCPLLYTSALICIITIVFLNWLLVPYICHVKVLQFPDLPGLSTKYK